MINKKKILLIASSILLVSLVAIFALIVCFHLRLENMTTNVYISFVNSLVQNEKRFLIQIHEELKKQGDNQYLTDRINRRIEDIDKNLPILSAMIEESRERTEWVYLSDQLSFLLSLLDDIDSENYLKERIGQRVVELRSNIVMHWAVSNADSVRTETENASRWAYLSPNAIQPKISSWKEGGGAVIYSIKGDFPFKNLINAISEYYDVQEMKPFDYDLCQPNRLGGLKEGWFEEYLWTQFWIDSYGSKIINVNIIRSYPPFSEEIGDALVVILYSDSIRLKDALTHYNTIHKDIYTEIDKEQSDNFFPFRQPKN